MDLSKFSTEDLQALRNNDISKVSTEGLKMLQAANAEAEEASAPPHKYTNTERLAQGFQGLGKAANLLWPVTGAPIGLALEKISGKKVFDKQDLANQYLHVNPWAAKGSDFEGNLKSFPSLDQMAERAGVPEGGKMSDLPGPGFYAKPSKDNPWWRPEVGGMLDPTLRGTTAGLTQIGADIGTWVAPEVKAADVVLNGVKGASSGVLRGGLQKLLGIGEYAAQKAGTLSRPVGEALYKVPYLGKATQTLVNPLGTVVSGLGSGMYGHRVLPIEHEGEKYGKEAVADTLHKAGVMTPGQVQERAGAARDALGSAAQALRDKADALGARGSMERAVQPAREAIADLRGQSATPEAQSLANDLEGGVNGYVARERGTPGTPGSPGTPPVLGQVPSPILDEHGQPFQHTVIVDRGTLPTPGSPGVPPLPSTANRLSGEKSFLYDNEIPKTAWDQARTGSKAGQTVNKELARGLKEETERAVDAAIPGAGADLADINRAYGGLASTKRSQRFVEQRGDREFGNLLNPGTGLDGVVGGAVAAATNSTLGGMGAVGLKKAIQSYQYGTMPLGYLLKLLGESNALDRLHAMSQSKPAGGK